MSKYSQNYHIAINVFFWSWGVSDLKIYPFPEGYKTMHGHSAEYYVSTDAYYRNVQLEFETKEDALQFIKNIKQVFNGKEKYEDLTEEEQVIFKLRYC